MEQLTMRTLYGDLIVNKPIEEGETVKIIRTPETKRICDACDENTIAYIRIKFVSEDYLNLCEGCKKDLEKLLVREK